jgi:multidrug efflux system outer membrane protein
MTARTLSPLVLASVLVASCAVGPDYKRPAVNVPPAYRFQDAASADSLSDRPWWNVFGDQALAALLEEALRNNYDLFAAAARVDSARAQARAAGARLLPGISANGSATYGNSFQGAGALPAPFWTTSAYGSVSWELDVFGRLRRTREAATAAYAASEEARRGVWVTILAEVAQTYFHLLTLDIQRAVAERTLSARTNTLDFFRVRVEGGVGTGLDVTRGEANVHAARGTAADVERQIALDENMLSLLLGRPPGPIRRASNRGALESPPDVPAGLPSALLERRPDVREAEANMVAANARIGIATANLFPTISLTAVGGVASTNLALFSTGGGGVRTSETYSVGAQAGWLSPILQGAALRHLRESAKAEWRAASAAYVQTILNAFKDVADALVTLTRLREQRVQVEQQVDALRRSVDLAHTQFEGGTATYLDVIGAEEELFPAELGLAQVQAAQLGAYVQLYRSLGGGWWIARR